MNGTFLVLPKRNLNKYNSLVSNLKNIKVSFKKFIE